MENDMNKLVRVFDVMKTVTEQVPERLYDVRAKARLDNQLRAIMAIPAVDAVEVSGATRQAVELIVVERRRQIAEWGVQSDINPFEFMSILGEEYGELCQAVNETLFVNPKHPERGGIDAIRREAVQVAAVAAQIIEACMDGRREDGDASD